MTTAYQFGEPVTVARIALLVLGLFGLYALWKLRPEWLAGAGAGLLGLMFATTVVPASTFDVCRPGWSLIPSRTVTAVRPGGSTGVSAPSTRPGAGTRAPERK